MIPLDLFFVHNNGAASLRGSTKFPAFPFGSGYQLSFLFCCFYYMAHSESNFLFGRTVMLHKNF